MPETGVHSLVVRADVCEAATPTVTCLSCFALGCSYDVNYAQQNSDRTELYTRDLFISVQTSLLRFYNNARTTLDLK